MQLRDSWIQAIQTATGLSVMIQVFQTATGLPAMIQADMETICFIPKLKPLQMMVEVSAGLKVAMIFAVKLDMSVMKASVVCQIVAARNADLMDVVTGVAIAVQPDTATPLGNANVYS